MRVLCRPTPSTSLFRSILRGGAGLAAALLGSVQLRAEAIVPEPMPQLAIAGFRFPESEATITGWVAESGRATPDASSPSAAEEIHLHGWGLWTALTSETAQVYEGQLLRVFETWFTTDDLADAPAGATVSTLTQGLRRRGALREIAELAPKPRARSIRNLRGPRTTPQAEPEDTASIPTDDEAQIDRVIGLVKFDPTSASHILSQELLHRSALDTLLAGGATGVTPFPATSIVVKPLFQIIKASDLVDGRYYALKAWEGPPATPQASPPTSWTATVWVDLLDGGNGTGAMDLAPAANGSTRTPATTYPLSSLINYRLSPFDAAALNANKPGTNAQAGDYAILVAMHVSGREIARWTWQTFWWSPNPDDPPAPSSASIASRRPDQLRGAARHYAMAQTYTMLNPDPPYVGGRNVGAAVYAYSPWMEARFRPVDLPDSLPGLDPNGQPADNNYGMQSNCMSCHAQASYNPRGLTSAPRFAGARYVDLTDPQFVGTLQVDFLWSLARHAK